MRRIGCCVAAVVAGSFAALPGPAAAFEIPVRHIPGVEAPTPVGGGRITPLPDVAPTPKQVDGQTSDWTGEASRYAGTSIYSHGELTYQDHLFDAYGAADDTDAAVFRLFERASAALHLDPRTHRPTATLYEFARDGGETYHFGSGSLDETSDLSELRLAADADYIYVLARTVSMLPGDRPGLLLLADAGGARQAVAVPFRSGLTSNRADVAILLGPGEARVADLHDGSVFDLPAADVAVNPAGYTNAIEARIPRDALTSPAQPDRLHLVAAAGRLNPQGVLAPVPDAAPGSPHVANVAFRGGEPVEPAFDREQALALHDASADPFFADVALPRLLAGATEAYEPKAGYHARTFAVPESISQELANRGPLREYGVYLPPGYTPARRYPLVTFLHGSSTATGATNHGYAALLPGLFREFGDAGGAIVVLPNDRQPATPGSEQGNEVGYGDWLGQSLVELHQVWADAEASYPVERDREYLTGYSMGGYGTYEIAALEPDRFAGALPIAGQVSFGDYIGVDFAGCERLGPPPLPGVPPNLTQAQRGDLCYPTSRPNQVTEPPYEGFGLRHPDERATNMLKVARNLRGVPFAIYAPLEDENQIYTNNLAAARSLTGLGYRFRLYTFPVAEHQTPGILDEWAAGAGYLLSFRRQRDPAVVSFARDMPLEREAELGTGKHGSSAASFDFDSAYWVSGLRPTRPLNGQATIEASSLAIADPPHRAVLEAGGPVGPRQLGPHLMLGQRWQPAGSAAPTRNAFAAALTGAAGVQLDLARMRIDVARPIDGDVATSAPLALRLRGPWAGVPSVTVNGQPASATLTGDVLEIALPRGSSVLAIAP